MKQFINCNSAKFLKGTSSDYDFFLVKSDFKNTSMFYFESVESFSSRKYWNKNKRNRIFLPKSVTAKKESQLCIYEAALVGILFLQSSAKSCTPESQLVLFS